MKEANMFKYLRMAWEGLWGTVSGSYERARRQEQQEIREEQQEIRDLEQRLEDVEQRLEDVEHKIVKTKQAIWRSDGKPTLSVLEERGMALPRR
jgi:uncharacterized protein YlxW (UPF0749 family)